MADARNTVLAYLSAMERRDMAAARRYCAPSVEFVFPGGRRPESLDGIVANTGRRYREVHKDIEGVDVVEHVDYSIAYVYGTLHGTWTDGAKFSGIRFVDRFELCDHLIARQWVWNDSAEARAAREAAAVSSGTGR